MSYLICGNYGATNIGDELILKGILEMSQKQDSCRSLSRFRLRDRNDTVVVLSHNPQETSKIHNVDSVCFLPCGFRSAIRSIFKLQIIKTFKAYWNCDEFIFGGGGLMQDDDLGAVFIWSLHILTAILLRKNLRVLGNSVGPLHKRYSKLIVRFLFNRASEITVRDEISKKLLEDIGVRKEVKVVEDFALELVVNGHWSVVSKKKYVILSLRDWLRGSEKQKFESELIELINYLSQEKGYEIIGIPFEKLRNHDELYLNQIKDQVLNKKTFHVQKYSSEINKIFELYSAADLVIGMRLHSIILAHKFKKPFIALSYSDKVKGFCESIEKEKFCIDLGKFNYESAKILIDKKNV